MDDKNLQAAKEGLKEQEIKKVSDAEIIEESYKRGRNIASAAQQTLFNHLNKGISESGIQAAIQYCNVMALPLVDSLARQFKAKVRRVSLKVRNPADNPDDIERSLLEAYEYSMENRDSLSDNVQLLTGDSLLYTKPITITNTLCLQCHGEKGSTLNPDDHKLIRSLYPLDSATGYKLGQLRGMWSIRMSKKDIIRDL